MVEKITTTLVDKEVEDKIWYNFMYSMWKLLGQTDCSIEIVEFVYSRSLIDL